MLPSNRIILNRIRRLSNGISTRILTIKGRLVNPETGDFIDCQADYGAELSAIIDGLIRDGYLVKLDEYRVALTDKGLHPYAQTWEDIKSFLFHSIAVPIAVSLVTTLITLYMTS